MSGYTERAAHDWTDDSIRIIATPSLTAKSTFFYVQEVGHFLTKPQYFTERSNLNSFLIVYTMSGRGHLFYKNKWHTIMKNQLFFIDCMDYQLYKTDKNDPWEILWVHFNGSTSQGYYKHFIKNGTPVITLEGVDQTVPMLIRKLIEIHRKKEARTELLSAKWLIELLTEVLLAANAQNCSENPYLPSYIRKMMDDLDKRFQEKISLDQLSRDYAISKFHLVREFKKYTGFTPNEYLINSRITYAKELLTYTDLTVANISAKVGIENVSHFINLFKKQEDITPQAYRKKWRVLY